MAAAFSLPENWDQPVMANHILGGAGENEIDEFLGGRPRSPFVTNIKGLTSRYFLFSIFSKLAPTPSRRTAFTFH
jgi:hypothetical protein